MNISISKVSLSSFVFFVAMIPAISYERILGLMPYSYFILYIVVLYVTLKNGSLLHSRVVNAYLLFFSFYIIYSLMISTNVVSSIIYSFMWMFNIFTLLIFTSINKSILYDFTRVLESFVIGSLIIGVICLFLGLLPHANIFRAWDKNNFSFLIYLSFSLSFYFRRYKFSILIMFLSLFVFSRTILMMYLTFFFLMAYKSSVKYVVISLVVSLFVFVLFILFGGAASEVIVNRILGSFGLIASLWDYFLTGSVSYGLEIDDWRRYYLLIANIDIIFDTFPIGTGLGLGNYLNYFDPQYISYTRKAARAHNFFVSYLAEMGFLFFILMTLFSYFSFSIKNYVLKFLFFGMFIGLLTNEYITSPMFWMLFGVCHNYYINKD